MDRDRAVHVVWGIRKGASSPAVLVTAYRPDPRRWSKVWSPYPSVQDAYKLDDVREALRKGDLKTATRLAKVFALTPVTV